MTDPAGHYLQDFSIFSAILFVPTHTDAAEDMERLSFLDFFKGAYPFPFEANNTVAGCFNDSRAVLDPVAIIGY